MSHVCAENLGERRGKLVGPRLYGATYRCEICGQPVWVLDDGTVGSPLELMGGSKPK